MAGGVRGSRRRKPRGTLLFRAVLGLGRGCVGPWHGRRTLERTRDRSKPSGAAFTGEWDTGARGIGVSAGLGLASRSRVADRATPRVGSGIRLSAPERAPSLSMAHRASHFDHEPRSRGHPCAGRRRAVLPGKVVHLAELRRGAGSRTRGRSRRRAPDIRGGIAPGLEEQRSLAALPRRAPMRRPTHRVVRRSRQQEHFRWQRK